MKVHVKIDLMDGIILADPNLFEKMDENILIAIDIYLDKNGESELVYDFPGEEWETVYVRESRPFVSFVESGGLWIKLLSDTEMDFSIEQVEKVDSKDHITVISGRVIIVSASELLQCLFYPELEMEILGSLEVPNGEYSIEYLTDGTINYSKVN